MKKKEQSFALVMNTKLMTAARTLLTAVLLVIGLNGAWADTSAISDGVGGWEKITSLPATLTDYYFVFVDDSRDLMLSYGSGPNQSTNAAYKTMVYRTGQNPIDNPLMLWEITSNTKGGWSIKNATEPTYYIQTEWQAAWYARTHDNGGGSDEWYNWTIEYADAKWTIKNGKYPDAGYIGPWVAAAFSDGQEVAANKTGANIGYFQIYAILRSTVRTSKEAKLNGFLKKARALNGVLNKAELTAEITEAQTKLDNHEYALDEIDAEIAVLQNLWMEEMDSTTPMITINNGNFDTDVNIAVDGTMARTYISPATAAKPYIYAVTGWTQNFKFDNTASQGNTAAYGATITGDKGNNGTNPPATDMFGQTAGGTLHLSSGWSDQARYKQTIDLPAGRYIVYYEANNQNNGHNTINSNYFGVGGLTAGDLLGTNNTWKYSDLKTYPYNEWTASATDFELLNDRDDAEIHIGVIGTTGGSANGAKLWVDNVELYYLGPTTISQATYDAIVLPSGQMNETVKAEMQDAYTTLGGTLSVGNYNVLQEKIAAANASIAEYEKINTYLTKLGTTSQLGDIPVADFQAADVYDKYRDGDLTNTGTYETLSEVLPLWRTFVAGYWANNAPSANADLTAFIVNQGFEMDNVGKNPPTGGWHVSRGATNGDQKVEDTANARYSMSNSEADRLFNIWDGNVNSAGVNLLNELSNLPAGLYKLQAVIASTEDFVVDFTAGGQTTKVTGTGAANGLTAEVQAMVTGDGLMDIAVYCPSGAGKHAFFKADNFRLIYLGNTISNEMFNAITLPTQQMNQTAKEEMVNAYNTLDNERTPDNYVALQEKITAAEASIAVYEQINSYLTQLSTTAQLGAIPVASFNADSVKTKYSDGKVNDVADAATGTYESLDEVLPLYKSFVQHYWADHTPVTTANGMTAFVVNHSFELDQKHVNEPTGWEVPNRGTDRGTFSTTGDKAMTNSHGNWLFNNYENANKKRDLRQVMSGLPQGTYEITAIVAGWDTSKQCHEVTLTANGYTKVQETTGEGNGIEVTMQTYVTDEGTLDFNIMANMQNVPENANKGTFFKADNIRLTYVSAEVSNELKQSISYPTGQMYAGTKEAMLAAQETFEDSGSNANYKAVMNAINAAQASIAVYDEIKTRLDSLNTVDQRGDITEAQLKELSFWTKYSDGVVNGSADATTGTYTSLDEVIPEYRSSISTFWTAHKAADKNMTAFIVNQGFEFGDYTAWGHDTKDSGDFALHTDDPKVGSYIANLWTTESTNLALWQDLSGLPEGEYELKAQLVSGDGATVTLEGGEESDLFTMGAGLTDVTLKCLVGTDGKMRVKAWSTRQDNRTYFRADNFRLIYKGATASASFVLPEKEEGIMKQTVRDTEDATYAAFESARTPDNYHAALAAYEAAVYSVACYVKAKETMDEVDDMLSKTNVYTYDAYKTFAVPYNEYKTAYTNRTMENALASTLYYVIFGNRGHHQTNIMVVPFLSSAWDCAEVYKWPAGDYWVNTWSKEGDSDGSNYKVPFLEYWTGSGTLAAKTLTATALGTNGREYTVKARVRLSASDTPTHIWMQVGNGTPVAITGTQIGTSGRYLTAEVSATGTAGDDGLKIKFIVEEGTNVSWLCFKDVWVDYSGETADISELNDAITTLGSPKLGFLQGQYSPYENVEVIQELAYARSLSDLGASAPPALVNAAIQELSKLSWKQNTEMEMNAIYRRSDYTTGEVYDVNFYNDEGGVVSTFRCLDPVGWDLDGRADAYRTRIQKLNVNTGDAGLRATDDSTGVFIKYDTNYGKQLGYTLPLEPNQKYSLSFIYTCWGENKEIKTNIHVRNVRTGEDMVIGDEGGFYGYEPNTFVATGTENSNKTSWLKVNIGEGNNIGNSLSKNWDVYHGFFTTSAAGSATQNDEYVIYFEKDRDYARDVLHRQGYLTEQYQVMLGDIYLVRYNDPSNVTFLDGESRDNTTPYSFDNSALHGQNIELNRSLTAGRWATLCLPFKLVWREMKQLYGIEKTYYYTGTTFSGHYAVLNFTGIDNGLRANTPVLVKVPEDAGNRTTTGTAEDPITASSNYGTNGGLIFRNYVCKSGTPIAYDTASERLFNFVGTYEVINMPLWSVFVRYNSTENRDEMVQKQDAAKRNWLQATRAYFKIDPSADGASVKLMSFTVDDIETGIMAIEPDGQMTVTSGNIYDLNGRMVRANAKTLEGLKPGIYVVDGRKVMIK